MFDETPQTSTLRLGRVPLPLRRTSSPTDLKEVDYESETTSDSHLPPQTPPWYHVFTQWTRPIPLVFSLCVIYTFFEDSHSIFHRFRVWSVLSFLGKDLSEFMVGLREPEIRPRQLFGEFIPEIFSVFIILTSPVPCILFIDK